jgi:hypothetical protein
MLDPWIIEEIRKREEDRQRRDSEVVIELPLPQPRENDPRPFTTPPPSDEGEQGVVVIPI